MALKLPMSSVRVHYDVDVGGSYGVKRGIKHTVLVGYLSRRLGVPVRLIEDRLENMRGGDMHGPERLFDVEVAFDDAGRDPLDEDARARQRRRLCGPLAVPARQAGRRHRRAVQDQERAVPGDRGGHQQDGAGGGARLRPGADQLRDRAHHRRGRQPARPRPPRSAPAQHDPARGVSRISSRAARPTTAATTRPSSTRCWRRPATPS